MDGTSTARRFARQLNPPDRFLTGLEMLVIWLTNLLALTLCLVVAQYLIAVAVPFWVAAIYLSQRRVRAAERCGLRGFVEQARSVSDDERRSKVAAIRRELGEWGPDRNWLHQVNERAAGRYD